MEKLNLNENEKKPLDNSKSVNYFVFVSEKTNQSAEGCLCSEPNYGAV